MTKDMIISVITDQKTVVIVYLKVHIYALEMEEKLFLISCPLPARVINNCINGPPIFVYDDKTTKNASAALKNARIRI